MGSFCSVISSVPVLSSSCWREFCFLKRPRYFIQRIKPVFVLKFLLLDCAARMKKCLKCKGAITRKISSGELLFI